MYGGSPMKTITIRLPDVEAAMLLEVQKINKTLRDFTGYISGVIRVEFARLSGH